MSTPTSSALMDPDSSTSNRLNARVRLSTSRWLTTLGSVVLDWRRERRRMTQPENLDDALRLLPRSGMSEAVAAFPSPSSVGSGARTPPPVVDRMGDDGGRCVGGEGGGLTSASSMGTRPGRSSPCGAGGDGGGDSASSAPGSGLRCRLLSAPGTLWRFGGDADEEDAGRCVPGGCTTELVAAVDSEAEAHAAASSSTSSSSNVSSPGAARGPSVPAGGRMPSRTCAEPRFPGDGGCMRMGSE